jgi:hypothetical protein
MRGSGRVKVHFRLAPDKSGYPPAASEFLWCMPTKRGSFIVDNIPFFARDISLGDEISAEKVGKALHFSRVLRKSKNSTVRVLLRKPDLTVAIREKLAPASGRRYLPQLRTNQRSAQRAMLPPKSPRCRRCRPC